MSLLLISFLVFSSAACSHSSLSSIQNSNVSSIFVIDGVSYDVLSSTFIEQLLDNGWKLDEHESTIEAYKEIKTNTIKGAKVERYGMSIILQSKGSSENAYENIQSVTFDSKNFKASNLRFKNIPLRATPEDVIMTLGDKYSKTEDEKGNITLMVYNSKDASLSLTYENLELVKVTISKN